MESRVRNALTSSLLHAPGSCSCSIGRSPKKPLHTTDVDGYKIVNIYKPPLTRLRTLDLTVFPYPCLYAGDFNCRHADWGYDDNSPDGECLAGWASINCLALLYDAKDAANFFPAAGTLALIQI